MENDTFTGGVGPGGLRTKNDIRVLLCYLLASVSAPLRQDDILSILQEYNLANYFEIMDALSLNIPISDSSAPPLPRTHARTHTRTRRARHARHAPTRLSYLKAV